MFSGAEVNRDVLLAVLSFTIKEGQLVCQFEGVDTEKASETSCQKHVDRFSYISLSKVCLALMTSIIMRLWSRVGLD